MPQLRPPLPQPLLPFVQPMPFPGMPRMMPPFMMPMPLPMPMLPSQMLLGGAAGVGDEQQSTGNKHDDDDDDDGTEESEMASDRIHMPAMVASSPLPAGDDCAQQRMPQLVPVRVVAEELAAIAAQGALLFSLPPISPSPPSPSMSPNDQRWTPKSMMWRTKPCSFFYHLGRCRKGMHCNFSHDFRGLSEPPPPPPARPSGRIPHGPVARLPLDFTALQQPAIENEDEV